MDFDDRQIVFVNLYFWPLDMQTPQLATLSGYMVTTGTPINITIHKIGRMDGLS